MWNIFKSNKSWQDKSAKNMHPAFDELDAALNQEDANRASGILNSLQYKHEYRDDVELNEKMCDAFNRLANFDYSKAMRALSHAAVNSGIDTEYRQERFLEAGLDLMEQQSSLDFHKADDNLRTVSMFARGIRFSMDTQQQVRLVKTWERAVNIHLENDDLYVANQEMLYASGYETAGLNVLAEKKWSETMNALVKQNPARARELASICLAEHSGASDFIRDNAQNLMNEI